MENCLRGINKIESFESQLFICLLAWATDEARQMIFTVESFFEASRISTQTACRRTQLNQMRAIFCLDAAMPLRFHKYIQCICIVYTQVIWFEHLSLQVLNSHLQSDNNLSGWSFCICFALSLSYYIPFHYRRVHRLLWRFFSLESYHSSATSPKFNSHHF